MRRIYKRKGYTVTITTKVLPFMKTDSYLLDEYTDHKCFL